MTAEANAAAPATVGSTPLPREDHAAADLVTAEGSVRGGLSSEAEAQFRAGVKRMNAGDHKGATPFLKKAVALDPKHIGAHNNLGIVLKTEGRLDDAIESFARALAIDSGYVTGIVNLGVALRDKGKNADAIACLRHAA